MTFLHIAKAIVSGLQGVLSIYSNKKYFSWVGIWSPLTYVYHLKLQVLTSDFH